MAAREPEARLQIAKELSLVVKAKRTSETKGEVMCPAPSWVPDVRRKLLLHKKIKNPAPTEGAGHSQGERRLPVICWREPVEPLRFRLLSFDLSLRLRSTDISSRNARGMPRWPDGARIHRALILSFFAVMR